MCINCATKASLTGKYYDAFPADGVGDFKPITVNTVLLVTSDTVPDDTSTTASVTVDGPAILAFDGERWYNPSVAETIATSFHAMTS